MKSIPSKIRKKTTLSILTTIIQHGFGCSSYGNQKRKKEKESRSEKK